MNKSKHIILIGFKHTGKSTLGKLLAKKINRPFVDCDKKIESLFQTQYQKHYTCRKIMQTEGPEFFKTIETAALKDILDGEPSVIALGGGTPMQLENQEMIKTQTLIHITGDPYTIFQRIMRKGRPAFFPANENPHTTFKRLWKEREQIYKKLTPIRIKNNDDVHKSIDKIYYTLLKTNALASAEQPVNLLLMHGPNLNMLGKRDPEHYGSLTLTDLENITREAAENYGFHLITYQSNHEGFLIDILQSQSKHCAGIIINPGAFTHYSYALHDALLDTCLPIVEVHLSKIDQREKWRSISVTSPACIKTIWGKKEKGYIEAVEVLANKLHVHVEIKT